MMRKKTLLVATMTGMFALFAVIRAPASLAVDFLPKEVRLDGCEGTLWQGRASALGVGGQVVQANVTWKFLPGRLWQGKLDWQIGGQFDQEESKLGIALSPAGIALHDAKLVLPAGPLLGLHDKLKILHLGGRLRLETASFALGQASSLQARLENLFSPLTPTSGPLGSYRLELTSQPAQPAHWQISPQEGILAISGSGTLNYSQGSLVGQLVFKPENKMLDNLKPVLASLPNTAGSYTLDFASR